MLIIEGTDLLGKTTLAKKLVQMANERIHAVPNLYPRLSADIVYSHFSRLPVGWSFPASYAAHIIGNTVMDRFHMSEIAYSFAREEPTQQLTYEMYRLVDSWLGCVGSLTVVLTANPYWLRERFKAANRDEMYDVEKIIAADQYFRALTLDKPTVYDGKVSFDFVHPVDERGYAAENEDFCESVIDAWLIRRNLAMSMI